MDFSFQCENPKCNTVSDKVYSIPLNKEWQIQRGSFCSVNCARFVNQHYSQPGMPMQEKERRDEWLLAKEKKSNTKKKYTMN